MARVDVRALVEKRVRNPAAVADAYLSRARRPLIGPSGRLMVVAADHPARGVLRAGENPLAMADRTDLLDRLLVAVARPGVDGLLATPDIVEDLLLLGALEEKVVIGSMNRGGLPGAVFEADDRFTAYDAATIERYALDGGKMMLRVDHGDDATADTIEACAHAVTALAERRLLAMVEPFIAHRVDGLLGNDLTAAGALHAAVIASGLGATSAYTWLKLPVVDEMERVAAATTLPIVLLGGEVAEDPDEAYARWEKALALPTVCGLVVGRSLLYPPDDDVVAAVDTAVSLLPTEDAS